MSGQIRMSPSELISKAQVYGKSSDQIETMLTELTNFTRANC